MKVIGMDIQNLILLLGSSNLSKTRRTHQFHP